MSTKKMGRVIAPLVLTIGILLSVTGVSSALAIYNFASEHQIFVTFVPDECTDFSWVPGAFCKETTEINPGSSWSSNNRGGSVTLGLGFHNDNPIAQIHPRGKHFVATGVVKTFRVNRQGWVEVRPIYSGNRLSELKLDIFDEAGKKVDTGHVRVMEQK